VDESQAHLESADRGIGKLPATVEEFDRRFDDGEDLHELGIDLAKATRPSKSQLPPIGGKQTGQNQRLTAIWVERRGRE